MKNSALNMKTARNVAQTAAMTCPRSKLPPSPNIPWNNRQAVQANQPDSAKYRTMNAARPPMASQARCLYAEVAAVRLGGTSVGPGGYTCSIQILPEGLAAQFA